MRALEDLLGALEPDVCAAARRLANRPEAPAAALREAVSAHLARVEEAPGDLIDRPLARRLGGAIERLFDEVWSEGGADARRAVQLAADYFTSREDAEQDLGSALGFEDDAEVVNAVARSVGRPDLAVEP